MTLYWIRNIKSNNPTVLRYTSHQTQINNAARETYNGRHEKYFRGESRKHDTSKDVLLFGDTEVELRGFHHDELQEESEDT